MTLTEFKEFLDYFEKVRSRTLRIIACIPPDKIEWTYQKGKFTLGDLIRHLATIERLMYAENAQFKLSKYQGCGKELAEGYENVCSFLHEKHQQSMEIFNQLTEEEINKKTKTPAGAEITLWKWLRLMAEHEIHHRGQIYIYISILGIETPPIYGLTSEEVIKRSEK